MKDYTFSCREGIVFLFLQVKKIAKRKRLVDTEKLIKEGRGQGLGKEYKPWIRIQDFPSLGRVTRIKGIKTERQHEL